MSPIEEQRKIMEKASKEDELDFKEDVKAYMDGENMSVMRKFKVKKFLKNLEKYKKIMLVSLVGIEKELQHIDKDLEMDSEEKEKEINDLQEEIVDRILDSKEIFDIVNPETGEEATKKNLMRCELNSLITLMRENVESLELTINGKID